METAYLIMPGKISDSFAEIVKIATENCQLMNADLIFLYLKFF